jgi:hypothetical protein
MTGLGGFFCFVVKSFKEGNTQMEEAVFENEFSLDEPVDSSPTTTETPAEPTAQHPTPETTDDKGSEPSGAEKRIQQLVAQREQERKTAEQERTRREELEREIEKLRQPAAQQQQAPAGLQAPVAPVAPEIDQYDDFSDYEAAEKEYRQQERVYIKDLAKYELLTELQERQQQEVQRRQQEEVHQRQATVQESFRAKIATAFEDDPDLRYQPIFADQTFPCTETMLNEVAISDDPVALMRHLNAHRDEAARIAALPPNQIARAIGRIEASFATAPPQPRTVSNAPEPIQPLGGGGSGIVGDLSDDQFFAQEAAKFR